MRQRPARLASNGLLRALVELHQADAPPPAERERLVARLGHQWRHHGQEQHRGHHSSASLASPGEVRRVLEPERQGPIPRAVGEVIATEPHDAQRYRWSLPRVALSVALAAGLVLWLVLERPFGRSTQPSAAANNPAMPTAKRAWLPGQAGLRQTAVPAIRPCFVAAGDRGLLWDSRQATPDLARLDGRSGRFLHHWATSGPDVRRPARVVAGPTGQHQRWLEAAGERSIGWGVKLSSALRLRAGALPEAIRFDCYDASAYTGVRFRARGKGVVLVLLQTSESVPVELGGQCLDKCWFTASHALALGEEWQNYELGWDRFGISPQSKRPEAHLMMLEFLVQRGPEPYRISVQEIALVTAADPSSSE